MIEVTLGFVRTTVSGVKARALLCMLAAVALALPTGKAADAPERSKPSVAQDDDVLVLEYQFEDLRVVNDGGSDHFSFKGSERYGRAGAPVIPQRAAQILVPQGKKIVAIDSVAVDSYVLSGTYRLPLGTKPRFKHPYGKEAPPFTPTEPDPEIHSMTELWPVEQHRLATVQSSRGYRVAHVNIFPLQVVPATGQVRMANTVRLTVRLVSTRPDGLTRLTTSLRDKLERRIDNPDAMSSYVAMAHELEVLRSKDGGNSPPVQAGGTLLSNPENPYYGADYKYIVITSEFLANEDNISDDRYSFQALCASKIARAIPAGIVTADWITGNYAGTRPSGGSDDQTRIRNFLVDAYQTWGTEYALLGGDKDIIPIRMFIDSDYEQNGDEYDIPADMYYGCVDPYHPDQPVYAFDGDGDGKYGEFTDGPGGEEVDLTAEILIGRASVATASEVVNFVRKTLVYESIDDPYLNEAGTMGSHLGFGGIQEFTKPFAELIRTGSNAYLGHFTAGLESATIADARAFNVTTIYDEEWYNEHSGRDYDSSTATSSEGVNWDSTTMGWDAAETLVPYLNGSDGYTTPHLLYISDHGAWNWGMVKLSTTQTSEARCDHLGNVKNTRPFFFYDDSCDLGAFDHDDCFAESITTMEHGAFACIVNAREGLGSEGNDLDSPSTQLTREFFHSVLGEGIVELGRAHEEAKQSALHRLGELGWIRYVYIELTLFGDPEVRLRVTKNDDGCPNDPNKTEPGLCGCGVAEDDGDGDGAPNCIDECEGDPYKTNAGVCGCGVDDVDSDGDGTPDCRDGCPQDPVRVDIGPGGCDGRGAGMEAGDPASGGAMDGMAGCGCGGAEPSSGGHRASVVIVLLLWLLRRTRRRQWYPMWP